MSMPGDVRVAAPFLDAEAVAAVLAERQRALAPAEAADRRARMRVLTWTLGEEAYATPLADLTEVAAVPRVTAVPGSPAALVGLISWRGAVVNLFDPAAALQLPAPAEPGRAMLVLRHAAPRIALQVSAVTAAASVVDPGATGVGSLTHFVEADGGQRLAIVDTALLIQRLLARPLQEG
ncbi:chemotaxis protein CheW [Sphingomonas sp. PL-96]|uniref:chemotaxis protein CheW n=1 Tax=Sphingomonas sp. PL-96 TaxID=2887201 RepID=UPI001E538388|nr:chemotaxis protein CheW [Sphingomonas sp. PL-96]MCC2975253.1 chemotaxis protein CheW [Sphingomonas sp. PL-96]